MPVRQTLLNTLATTIACAVLTLSAAHADTAVFKDVLKPHGHVRSKAEKLADAASCGMSEGQEINVIMPVFEKCMRAKGWAFDHYIPDPSSTPNSGTNVNFTDTRGDGNAHPRADAALRADSRACKVGDRDEESRPFKQCMATHGWQFIYAQHAPRSTTSASREDSSGWQSGSSSSSSSDIDDQVRHDDESRAETQAGVDAINAAIQETNDMNAAAAQQNQIDQNLANMPQN
jgi:hypothetical protein